MYKKEQAKVSRDKEIKIIYYYKELYENYEMKTVPEISEDLGIDISIIYKFLASRYNSYTRKDDYPKLMTMIMLCTKFGNTSYYYAEQQQFFSKIIKKRQILKEVKSRTAKLNEKRKIK